MTAHEENSFSCGAERSVHICGLAARMARLGASPFPAKKSCANSPKKFSRNWHDRQNAPRTSLRLPRTFNFPLQRRSTLQGSLAGSRSPALLRGISAGGSEKARAANVLEMPGHHATD